MNKKARDNRANQLNPNNKAYYKSRQNNQSKKHHGGSKTTVYKTKVVHHHHNHTARSGMDPLTALVIGTVAATKFKF